MKIKVGSGVYDESQFTEVNWEFIFSIDHVDGNINGVCCAIMDYETLSEASKDGAIYFTDCVQSRAELEGVLAGFELANKCTGMDAALFYLPFNPPNLIKD